MDNNPVHRTPPRAGRNRPRTPRFRVRFTPTSASWLNLVEVWSGLIEPQGRHRADLASVPVLDKRTRAFVTGWNDRCHPFVWTETSTEIHERTNRPTTSKTAH